ncbi:hypothetical protein DWF00_21880 [Bosea caraganae]|uniref:Right handed beta helix domain-containing protein n=1 Tax=Bosea caraganae TaxID=2763117 RepID=A0A370L5T6_9HYPH|nr:right-handed parallel beta-helix repeat-containing protein [Bosea caraganae]RDJ23288.1 hypothetical protein DWF00_21880 [Bosea caraganae]RDJ24599.1 hypothetical protein DWE98_13015 [Bosea caraganae]
MDSTPGNVIWVSTSGRAGALGTAADPYNSLQAAINHAAPGSTIMVKAGVYTENVSVRVGGTEAAPLRIVSVDGPGAAEIRPASQTKDTIEISRVDHVVLDGLKVVGPTSSSGNAMHVHAHISGSEFDPATNIVVQNSVITAGAGDGIKLSKVEHITLLNNTITGSTGTEEGIDAVGVHHLVISGNTVTNSGGVAINVKGGSYDVLIENNHVDGAASHGIGIGGYTEEAYFWPGFIGAESYEVKDIRVVGNEVENTLKQGIRVIGGQDVEIADNWIHDVAHQYAVGVSPAGGVIHNPPWPSDDVTITGNLFDKTTWLRVDVPTTHTSVSDNAVGNLPPVDWHDTGAQPTTAIYDDTYYVGNASDQVLDGNGYGHDTVLTSTSYTLAAGQEIEALKTISATSTGAIKLVGNEFGQAITGNAGANVINGREGNDILTGGAGADTFVFDTVLKPNNIDRIVDFSVADDTLRLENSVFLTVGKAGALAGEAFWTGAAAHDSSDRIVYDSATGKLFYDADGTGAQQAIQFAELATGLHLTTADVAII